MAQIYRMHWLLSLSLCSGCVFTGLADPPDEVGEVDMGESDLPEADLPEEMGPDRPEGCTGIDVEVTVADEATIRLHPLGNAALLGAWDGQNLQARALVSPSEIGVVKTPDIQIDDGDAFDLIGGPVEGGDGIELVVASVQNETLVLDRCTPSGCDNSLTPDVNATYLGSLELFKPPSSSAFYLGAIRDSPGGSAPAVLHFDDGFSPNTRGTVIVSQKLNTTPDGLFGSDRVRIRPVNLLMEWNLAAMTSSREYVVFSGQGAKDPTVCGRGGRSGKALPVGGSPNYVVAQETPEGVVLQQCDITDPTNPTPRSPPLPTFQDFDITQNGDRLVVAWANDDLVQLRVFTTESASDVINIAEGRGVTQVAVQIASDDSVVRVVVVDQDSVRMHQFQVQELQSCF